MEESGGTAEAAPSGGRRTRRGRNEDRKKRAAAEPQPSAATGARPAPPLPDQFSEWRKTSQDSTSGARHAKGDKVRAMHLASTAGPAKSPGWFPGKIKKVNADGTYDIHYDDGDNEKNVLAKFITVPKVATPPPPPPPEPEPEPEAPRSRRSTRRPPAGGAAAAAG